MIDIISLVNECYNRLPGDIQRAPWTVTDHGRATLTTEQQLDAYLAAYGEAHIIKCRAALQNLPYDNLRQYNFEIFDWGCGQGLASLTLIEALSEHQVLNRLRKVTLIDVPGSLALKRATRWISQYTGSTVTVEPLERAIPSKEDDPWEDVTCQTTVCINLFSNILDIRSISLAWLAKKTASLATQNYMVCVGPKFSSNSRLTDFCGYFNPQSYYTRISTFPYGYISKTHHAFGCEAATFIHKKEDKLHDGYQEKAKNTICDYDDDYSIECLRGTVDDDILNTFKKLKNDCAKMYDDFFLRPLIGVDTPDIFLASVARGFVIVNVCKLENIEQELHRIEEIKDEIFNSYVKSLKIASVKNPAVFYDVKCVLYFPQATSQELEQAKTNSNTLINEGEKAGKGKKHKDIYKFVSTIAKDQDLAATINGFTASCFSYEYYNELIKLITGHWHSYKDGDKDFKLTDKQKGIVQSSNKKIKVRGIAGSGKTLVAAHKAVVSQLRTGNKVLIITFNLTLRQYIKMRINQVPADFPTNKFIITNYHQFFLSMARSVGAPVTFGCCNDASFFDSYKERTPRFKTIIIDEVQDFREEWLRSIINNFLTEDGSVTVLGDGEQNIYDRVLEQSTKMPAIPTIPGNWTQLTERISMRIINPKITRLASAFAKEYLETDGKPISTSNELQLQFDTTNHLRYWYRENVTAQNMALAVTWITAHYKLSYSDIAVLGQSINLLRDMEYALRETYHIPTMTSFERKEDFNDVYGAHDKTPALFQKDLRAIRRAAKTHFTTDCNAVKLSTIHSFKGWEAKTVILFLQPELPKNTEYDGYYIENRENSSALVYTAITRARCNLFIINVGNKQYHAFFEKNITK